MKPIITQKVGIIEVVKQKHLLEKHAKHGTNKLPKLTQMETKSIEEQMALIITAVIHHLLINKYGVIRLLQERDGNSAIQFTANGTIRLFTQNMELNKYAKNGRQARSQVM